MSTSQLLDWSNKVKVSEMRFFSLYTNINICRVCRRTLHHCKVQNSPFLRLSKKILNKTLKILHKVTRHQSNMSTEVNITTWGLGFNRGHGTTFIIVTILWMMTPKIIVFTPFAPKDSPWLPFFTWLMFRRDRSLNLYDR